MKKAPHKIKLALHKKSGSVLGEGQYRNAVASGESPSSRVNDVHRRPDATALRYWPCPTV